MNKTMVLSSGIVVVLVAFGISLIANPSKDQIVIYFPVGKDFTNSNQGTATFEFKFPETEFKVGEETADIERGEGESDDAYAARKTASVAYARYNENKEVFRRLQSLRYRFMAQIGKEEAKPFDEVKGIVDDVLTAA